MTRIVCAGHVNWDVTLTVGSLPVPDGEAVIDDQTQAGGGSASNVAAVLSGLGCEAVLLGSVGDDENGYLARRELADAGVDCTHLQEAGGRATTVKYLVVDGAGEVMVLANQGANEAFTASDLPAETLSAATHLHLTSQDPTTAQTLAERARNAGVPVSIDPGRRVGDRQYRTVLALADVVFLNGREADIAREQGLLDAVDGETIVTQGSDGADRYGGEEIDSHRGFDAATVDTAGAGDAFAAGFLAARYTADADPLAVANACGALAAESVGARTDITWTALRERLD